MMVFLCFLYFECSLLARWKDNPWDRQHGHPFLAWQLGSNLSVWFTLGVKNVQKLLRLKTCFNTSGIDEWPGGTLPAEKYLYCCSCCSLTPVTTEWETLADADDEATPQILKWFHDFKVLKVPGSDIVFEEELRFVVHSSEVTTDPWSSKITVFDVRCQMDKIFTFKVKTWTPLMENLELLGWKKGKCCQPTMARSKGTRVHITALCTCYTITTIYYYMWPNQPCIIKHFWLNFWFVSCSIGLRPYNQRNKNYIWHDQPDGAVLA